MKNEQRSHEKNLQVLFAHCGSFNRVAKAIGLDPAHFNRNKWNPSSKLREKVACRAQLLRLHAFIKLIRQKYNISDQQAQTLMQEATNQFETPKMPLPPP